MPRFTFLAPLVLLGLGLAAPGCGDGPSEGDAQDAYARHRAFIDRAAREIREELAKGPLVRAVRCEDPEEVARANDPARTARLTACQQERIVWTHDCAEAWRSYRIVPVRFLDSEPAFLGLQMEVRIQSSAMIYPLNVGSVRPIEPITPPEQGFSRDGRRIGYHRFRTAFRYETARGDLVVGGDQRRLPGIEVTWETRVGDATAKVRLMMLTEGETPAAWRTKQRQRLVD